MSSSADDRRIPSLDGMRGYLLCIVLLVHLAGTQNFPMSRDAVPLDIGYLCVRVFFVISGFLITGILLNDVRKRGTIDLKRFYIKRAFRIFPAYYALLLFVATLAAIGLIELRPNDLLHAFTYTANYHPDRSWYLGHAWSLSVEEQFYFLWPAILLLFGVRRGAWIALGFMAIVPAWRILLLAMPPGTPGLELFQVEFGHTFDTVGDSVAVGCLLAILRDDLWKLSWYRRLLSTNAAIALPAFTIVVQALPMIANQVDGPARYAMLTAYEAVGRPLVNVTIAMMCDWSMRFYTGRVGAALNHPWMVKLGVMSYSMYLWQQIFLNRHSDSIVSAFPLNLALTVAFGWASHAWIETPFLGMRDRWDARWRARRAAAVPAAPVPVGTAATD